MTFIRRSIALTAGSSMAVFAVACGGADTQALPAAQPALAATAAIPTAPAAPSPTALPAPQVPPQAAAENAFVWEIDDVDAGTKPALALTSDDVPYLAYMQEDQHGFVKNAVLSGGSWDITTVAEGYFYGPLDIAIGPDDVAHISYHDHQEQQFQPDKGDAAYAILDNGEWRVDTVFDDGHDGWDNRIVIDASGRPHISAIDPEEFGGNGVEYYHQDESGDWVVESVGTGPLTYKYATSVAIDPEGNAHITYYDQKDNDLALANRGSSGWDTSKVDTEGDTGLFASLLIDEGGRYHISYLQKTSETSGVVKYATRAASDTAWEIAEIDTLTKLTFGFIGARNITSVVVDGAGNPWVAYSDEKLINLAIWNGSDWEIGTVVDAGLQTLGQLVSLKLDSENQPHIAYFIVTNKGPLEGRVKYAKGTPT